MSCCKNNGTFLTRSWDNTCCNRKNCCDNYDNNYNNSCECNDPGISCPNINNNDCCCQKNLREVACRLTNQRVIIHIEGCKMCVVIVSIGSCFIKAVNPCTQKVVYFNLNRIDNIEDVLPRCYY